MATSKYITEIEKDEEEARTKASDVYQQIVNDTKDLTENQTNQIDSFIDNETDRINNSTTNNINELTNANTYLENNYQNELLGSQKDYQKQVSLPISETARIGYQTAMENRQLTAQESRKKAYQEYLNQSEQAKLIGDSTIAQIALQALKEKLNFQVNMNQYNSAIMQDKIAKDRELSNNYWGRKQNTQNALNSIDTLAENKRQFNKTLSYNKNQSKIENKRADEQYKLDLKNARESYYNRYRSSGSGGKSSANEEVILTNNNTNNNTNTSKSDAEQFGTFSNGYQPKGVNGSKLSASGLKVWNVFDEGTSQKNATAFGKQNIWKDEKGNYWVWDGTIRDYIDVTSKVKSSQKNKVNYQWGR